MVDDVIGSSWGYTEGMKVSGGAAIVRRLVDTVSKDGFYLLNVSPRADGAIPDDQQRSLLEVGAWLNVNGEAIYGSHAWSRFGDKDWRYTVKDGALYAIGPVSGVVADLAPIAGKVRNVELLGRAGALAFTQDAEGLHVQLGAAPAGAFPVTLKLTGLALR